MSRLQPPPIRESFFNSTSAISQIWIKWFTSVFQKSSNAEDSELVQKMESTPKDYSSQLTDVEVKALLEPTPKDYDRELEDLELKRLLEPTINSTWENRIADLESDVSVLTGSYLYRDSLTDDGTTALPTIVNGAWGFLVVGADEERATFTIKNDGTVNLIMSSANIVVNANTDLMFCIGTSVANPLTIKNRLGSSKAVLLNLWYS